ncbi:hypothetical protein [Marisediminicola sp. LYQ85]|uniref:hypothetical protein n=1 Tax=Marisediminicola sp. LYQ85 TaxID=3391062 RepID=UPI0039836476
MTLSLTSNTLRHRTRRRSVAITLAVAGMLALSSCAAAATSPDGADTSPETLPDSSDRGGISGEIAAASDGVLQVQDTESQTAVAYTDDTDITATTDGSLDDVTVGSCVTALPAGEPGAERSGDDGADDGDTAAADTAAFGTIAITAATDGECGFGAGGFGGGFGGDAPEGQEPPEGQESPPGASGVGGPTSGLVTATEAGLITVETTDADGGVASARIGVDDSTAFTVTVSTDASALVVGQCVAAQGESDDSGGLAAVSMTVSDPTENGCSLGTGRAPMGGTPGDMPGAPGFSENGSSENEAGDE